MCLSKLIQDLNALFIAKLHENGKSVNLDVLISESTDELKPLLRPRKTICEVKNE